MRDHQIVALAGVVTDSGRGVVNHKHVLGIYELEGFFAAHFFLHGQQRVVHALAEGQVIDGGRHHDGDLERLVVLRADTEHGNGQNDDQNKRQQ